MSLVPKLKIFRYIYTPELYIPRSLGKHLQQVHENEGLVEENGLEDTNIMISNIQSLENTEHENKKVF